MNNFVQLSESIIDKNTKETYYYSILSRIFFLNLLILLQWSIGLEVPELCTLWYQSTTHIMISAQYE